MESINSPKYRKCIYSKCGKVNKIYFNNDIEGDHEESGVEGVTNEYQLTMMEEENG